jgi:hypothetical protein
LSRQADRRSADQASTDRSDSATDQARVKSSFSWEQ